MGLFGDDENKERNKGQLSELDKMYGYEDPAAQEEEEGKSFAQKIADTLKMQREKALGKSRVI